MKTTALEKEFWIPVKTMQPEFMNAKQHRANKKCPFKFLILFAALYMFLVGAAQAQLSGPPQIPPYPDNALMFYPLETPPWNDFYDDPAKGFTNLNVAPSWDYAGTAVSLDTNCGPYLQYDVYQDGYTNILFENGSLSTWFQGNWTSVTDGGTGPTNWATVLSIGNWTSDAVDSAWTIAISPEGTNLVMEAQSEGTNQVVFNVPIDVDSGDWHSLTLTYSPSNCCLYLEGQLVTNAPPIEFQPSYADCTNDGFFVGSVSTNGNLQFHGQFQWLATYDYPLSAGEVADDYAGVSGFIQYWGGSLPPVSPTGGFNPADDGPPSPSGTNTNYVAYTNYFFPPTNTLNSATDYAAYTNFWLVITNISGTAYVTVQGTLSNLTYEILTNGNLANSDGWAVWQILQATNNFTFAPPLALGTNQLFFEGALISVTTTNGLSDWWCMEYFNTLNVDPYADPDGDGLCNLDEFILGTNPTNAYSKSSIHKDAEAEFLAYTNDTNCVYKMSITNGADTNTLLVTMWPTQIGTNYQIYSFAETNGPWIVETNFLGTNTNTTVPIHLNGRTLSLIGGDGEDPDGDGLPSGYEVLATLTDPLLPDTGLTGTPDGYKDPDGDGYLNLQEMYNGTDPHVFNTPAGSPNAGADLTSATNFTFYWQAASGPVIGYVISTTDGRGDWTIVTTNSPSMLSYVFNESATNFYEVVVQALYANGLSTFVYPDKGIGLGLQPSYSAPCAIVNGPGGHRYFLTSQILPNLAAIRVTAIGSALSYPIDNRSTAMGGPYGPVNSSERYGQVQQAFPPFAGFVTNIVFDVPVSSLTNGIAQLPDADLPLYGGYSLQFQGINSNGNMTPLSESSAGTNYALPFLDETVQMQQNIAFQLRAAGEVPFGYSVESSNSVFEFFPATNNFVCSDYSFCDSNTPANSGYWVSRDSFKPVEDSYFYLNFVFQPSLIDSAGKMETGFDPSVLGWVGDYFNDEPDSPTFAFSTYSYLANSNGLAPPAMLAESNTQWLGYNEGPEGLGGYYPNSSGETGMTNLDNVYGLAYESIKIALPGTPPQYETLTPGGEVSGSLSEASSFGQTAAPGLQTVGYYFARVMNWPAPPYDIPVNIDPMPDFQDGSFTTNSTTPPLILGAVGHPMTIAGYEKQKVTNSAVGVYAYLGQYFTNAFVMTNGNLTTNSAGILSEYGEFFPTVPGHVGLLTKPDATQSNSQGTNEVDIIRLSLDVNHDGTMNETFTGPDNTSSQTPFVFWINNDYDRWTDTTLDGLVEDDVSSNSLNSVAPMRGASTPDFEFRDYFGHRLIPCPRDLEDYTRLWVSGVSNTLSRLPSGSAVTLGWAGYENSPSIDVFQAADADGGIGYLTNLVTASNQINTNFCRYVGRIAPGTNLLLNALIFSNGWAGDHYIFCGVSNGIDELDLTIYDSSSNVLVRSSQWIQIEDIKHMYERWTVGDNDNNNPISQYVPASKATLVEDGQPYCRYSYDPAYDTNDDYILFVHGWNMQSWEKDRFAETAYKRLYWQGYQGRFGEFRWPTTQLNLLHTSDYDNGEWVAWKSASALKSLLSTLNGYYPSNVYVLAHSMGNVVTGEALRLAASNVLVNTYVASQAAISARAYDNGIPADATNFYVSTGHAVYSPDSEGHYYTNGAPSYFNGIGGALNFVDFYNSEDWALSKWVGDQGDKPEPNYFYSPPTVSDPSGYWESISFSGDQRSLAFGTNTYEIFSQIAKSYSFSLGAETNIANTFTNSLPINLDLSPYSFGGNHPGHSEQFRFDNMTTSAYWKQLLSSFDIQP